jgi:hypothetical protein
MYNGFLTNLYIPVTINALVGVKGIGVPLPTNTKLPEQERYTTIPIPIGASPKYRYIPMGDKRILWGIQIKKKGIIKSRNSSVPNEAIRVSATLDFISFNL